MKRLVIAVLILICTGVMMGWTGGTQGGGSAPGEITEPVEIDLWYSLGAKYAAPLEKIIKDWNASNPMISVTGLYQGGYSVTRDKLLTAWIAENTPIMSQIDQCFAGVFVDNNALISLEGIIKNDKSFDLKDFNPYILKGGTYHREVFGLPLNISTPILYYNRELFRSSGLDPDKTLETWDEAYEYAAKMTDPAKSIYGFRVYSSDWIYHSLLKQFGSDLFSPDDTKAIFNNKAGKEAVGFWKKMCDDKVALYQAGAEASAMDAAGKIGIVPRSTGSLHWYADNATFDYGAAPFTLGKKKAVSLGGGNIYIFEKTTPQEQQAAWEFLKYMTNTENLANFAVNTGYMASRKSSLETPELKKLLNDDPRYRVTYDQLVDSFPAPKVASFSEVDDIFHEALDRILLEGASVDILDEAAAKVTALLE